MKILSLIVFSLLCSGLQANEENTLSDLDILSIFSEDKYPVLLTNNSKSQEAKKSNQLSFFRLKPVPADILFLIDNSGSMSPYQESLKNNFKKMIDRIHSDPYLDYRIGVINSSVADSGHLLTAQNSGYSEKDRPFITKEDLIKGGSGAFTDLVNRIAVGSKGDGNELFYYPLVRIIEEETKLGDLSFFRKDAFLVIIIMTDEDESRVGASDKQTHLTDQELISYLYSFKKDLSKIISFSITSGFIPEGETEKSMKRHKDCFFDKKQGSIIRNLITQLKGNNYSLCADFTKSLDIIGEIIKKKAEIHMSPDLKIDNFSPFKGN